MIPLKCLSIHALFTGDIQATVDVKLLWRRDISVDTDDAEYKSNSIRKASTNIWRPCLLACLVIGLQQNLIYFTAVHNIPLFIAFFGNHLILVALHKVHSLLPPSKLSYRCLGTGVEDVVPKQMVAFLTLDIATGIIYHSDFKRCCLQTPYFLILGSLS